MEGFLEVRPLGPEVSDPVRGRVPRFFHAELLEIAPHMVASMGYRLSPEAETALAWQIEHRQLRGTRDGGNARLARNLLEAAVRREAVRRRGA